jgi:N6-adenosine-specific RNA methylase IME4
MNEPRELVLLTDAAAKVAEASTIDEVKQIRDAAEAARGQSKKIDLTEDITVDAAAIKVQATRQLGKLLKATELAKGAPGNQYTGKEVVRSQAATGPIRLRDLGITKSESSRAQQVASLPAKTFEKYVKECIESRHEPTTAGLLRLAKQQTVNSAVLPEDHSSGRFVRDLHKLIAEGRRFSTIYADPPWKYDNQGTRAATNNHYPTMTVEQIAAEPVADLAADNCHLHLWTTNGFLPAAFSIIAAWGFTYKSMFVWVKPTLGIGNYWRCSHELLLFALRGNLPFRDRGQRSWIELDRQGHSVKPEEIRSLVEKVSPGAYLELFGRIVPENPAWTVYGNELVTTD